MEEEQKNTKSKQNMIDAKCDCGCGCNTEHEEIQKSTIEDDIKVIIDGKLLIVTDNSKNIVELAKEVGVSIPAPCFLAKGNKGCCCACIIEVDGEQLYACGTKPKDGMEIIVNRDDLKAIRKERLLEYKKSSLSGESSQCCCS